MGDARGPLISPIRGSARRATGGTILAPFPGGGGTSRMSSDPREVRSIEVKRMNTTQTILVWRTMTDHPPTYTSAFFTPSRMKV